MGWSGGGGMFFPTFPDSCFWYLLFFFFFPLLSRFLVFSLFESDSCSR